MAVDSQISRPIPDIEKNKLYGPYFQGLQNNKLLVQQCNKCGHVQWPARDFCNRCHDSKLGWKEIQQSGNVYTYSIMYRAFHLWYKERLPYAVVAVELEEGIRMLGSYFGSDVESLECGMRMNASFDKVNEDVTVLTWIKDETK